MNGEVAGWVISGFLLVFALLMLLFVAVDEIRNGDGR